MEISGRFVKITLTWCGFKFKSCDINPHVKTTESKKLHLWPWLRRWSCSPPQQSECHWCVSGYRPRRAAGTLHHRFCHQCINLSMNGLMLLCAVKRLAVRQTRKSAAHHYHTSALILSGWNTVDPFSAGIGPKATFSLFHTVGRLTKFLIQVCRE